MTGYPRKKCSWFDSSVAWNQMHLEFHGAHKCGENSLEQLNLVSFLECQFPSQAGKKRTRVPKANLNWTL